MRKIRRLVMRKYLRKNCKHLNGIFDKAITQPLRECKCQKEKITHFNKKKIIQQEHTFYA